MIRFLTIEEIRDLTGRAKVPDQIAWLKENRYLFEIGGDGKPKVLEQYLLSRLGGVSSSPKEPELRLS